jgi:hypothetical protein
MRLVLGVILVSSMPAVWADTIFTNGAPITDPNSDCSPSCTELTTRTGSGVFSLPADATITEIDFWTFQLPDAYDGGALSWGIYADNSGSQGSLVGFGDFTLSQTDLDDDISVAQFGPLTEYQNTFTIPDLNPSAGNYFLDIADMSGKDGFGIFWATSGPGALAFQVDGTVDPPDPQTPELASVWLLASGLACVLAYKARLRFGTRL